MKMLHEAELGHQAEEAGGVAVEVEEADSDEVVVDPPAGLAAVDSEAVPDGEEGEHHEVEGRHEDEGFERLDFSLILFVRLVTFSLNVCLAQFGKE